MWKLKGLRDNQRVYSELVVGKFVGNLHLTQHPHSTSNANDWLGGERGRTRTCDPCLKRALLYQLSYAPIFYNQALAEVV